MIEKIRLGASNFKNNKVLLSFILNEGLCEYEDNMDKDSKSWDLPLSFCLTYWSDCNEYSLWNTHYKAEHMFVNSRNTYFFEIFYVRKIRKILNDYKFKPENITYSTCVIDRYIYELNKVFKENGWVYKCFNNKKYYQLNIYHLGTEKSAMIIPYKEIENDDISNTEYLNELLECNSERWLLAHSFNK